MPYSVHGKQVYKEGKPWREASSHEKAVGMMHILQAKEHNPNWKPTKKPKK